LPSGPIWTCTKRRNPCSCHDLNPGHSVHS
jgi:hypothetical protein